MSSAVPAFDLSRNPGRWLGARAGFGLAVLIALATVVPSNPIAAVEILGPRAQEEPDIVLTPEQRGRLAELGWPPAPPIARPPDDDFLQRRGGTPVSGALQSLHAFAVVRAASGDVRIPREEIGFILLNGQPIPVGAPALPLAEDAVLLLDGRTVVVGRVEVEGDVINVAGRTIRQSEAALIRLGDPAANNPPFVTTPGGASGPPTGGAGPSTGPSTGPGGFPGPGGNPSAGPPVSSDEIPWGEAVWRGTVTFTLPAGITVTESGSYYVTFAEEPMVFGDFVGSVRLNPLSLVYQYTRTGLQGRPDLLCPPQPVSAQGMGIDGGANAGNPEITSWGYLTLPSPGPREGST